MQCRLRSQRIAIRKHDAFESHRVIVLCRHAISHGTNRICALQCLVKDINSIKAIGKVTNGVTDGVMSV